jgi:dipeptidyl aminopeptidase/acylaminoacyl peptidase
MTHAISRTATLVVAAILAVGFWPGVSGAAAEESATTGAPSAADLLSLRSPLNVGVLYAPTLSPPAWSPDGSQIAYLGSAPGNSLGLWSISVSGGSPQLLVDNVSLSGQPKWSPKGEYLAYVSTKGGDSPEIWLWNRQTQKDVQLTHMGESLLSLNWSPDGTRIAFSDGRYGNQDVYVVTVPDGKVLRLTGDSRYELFPTWTPDGRQIVFDRLDAAWVRHDLMVVPSDGATPPRVVADAEYFDYRTGAEFGYAPVSPDGQWILFRSERSGWMNYWTVPVSGGAPRPVAAENVEQSEATWSPDGKWVAYVANRNGTQGLSIVAATGGAPRALVNPPMGIVSNIAWSADSSQISYTFEDPTSPAELFTVNVQTSKVTQLTSPYSNLPRQALAQPRKITYPSADGYTISAYLYEPRNLKPGEKAPGIMWVHGGPHGQWKDSYQPEVQFFLDRGYALLMPNIRGSAGYGKNFRESIKGCWGHCDLQDVLAGVDYLKHQPNVNAAEIGIHGVSYGGIMTMYAITFAPGVFQAAVPESGYGDWVTFHEWANSLADQQLIAHDLGSFPEAEKTLRHSSAIYSVAQVTTPAFVIQGADNLPNRWRPAERSNPEALDYAHALGAHSKLYRYKAYPNNGYYINTFEATERKLEDMLAFFDQYLKDGLQTAPSAAAALSAESAARGKKP